MDSLSIIRISMENIISSIIQNNRIDLVQHITKLLKSIESNKTESISEDCEVGLFKEALVIPYTGIVVFAEVINRKLFGDEVVDIDELLKTPGLILHNIVTRL